MGMKLPHLAGGKIVLSGMENQHGCFEEHIGAHPAVYCLEKVTKSGDTQNFPKNKPSYHIKSHLGTKLPPLATGAGAVLSGLGASDGVASL